MMNISTWCAPHRSQTILISIISLKWKIICVSFPRIIRLLLAQCRLLRPRWCSHYSFRSNKNFLPPFSSINRSLTEFQGGSYLSFPRDRKALIIWPQKQWCFDLLLPRDVFFLSLSDLRCLLHTESREWDGTSHCP